MRTIRRELGEDVEELVEHAERLMDWRYYWERYPWACLGAAALLGYFVVPGRTITFPPAVPSLGKIATRLSGEVQRAGEAKKPSLLSSLVSTGTGMVLRGAAAYVTQQLGKTLLPPSAGQPVEVHDG
jgi:hypothetical protein